jgi:protein involved in polysaccharide export with SLBB domain
MGNFNRVIAAILILLFTGNTFALEIQTIPVSPQTQAPASGQQISPTIQVPQPQPAQQAIPQQLTPPLPQKPQIEKLSEFEQYISGAAPSTVSTAIRQFGYDLFLQPPSTFAPVEKVPVGPDYVLGPGDEIKITIWGKVEGQWSVVVDRDGNITLPKAGIIGVTGLTFKELKELLYKEFSKYFTGFEMNVSMGALRTIRVYVVGNAERPGAYTVSSLSTLVNALFEAGGPSKTGTMRDIQVKRNGKTIINFDMYDFLLKGDKTKDVRLMPEDVIFIPPVGPLAAIAGSVNNPAIYEIKGEKRISELIEMAGGLSTVAFKGRVQIERIIDGRKQVVFESEMDAIKDKDLAIQPGDVLKIFQVVQDKKVVRLTGAVQREGEYGFSQGMTVKDLLLMAGGLKYYAYNKDAELTRVHVTDKGPTTEKIMINLEKALEGDPNSNISLKENDYLFVRTVPEWKLYQTATINGETMFPGTYTIKKGERLSSLIERAGGYTDRAYLRGVVFIRERVRELQQKSLEEMIMRLERELLAESSVQVSTAVSPEEIQAKKVEIESKQKFIESLKKVKATGRMSVRIAHLRLLKGSEYDIELEEGDRLFIPSVNSVVNVVGSVMSQGSFIYSDKLDYKEYIEMTGGYSRYADTDNVYVLKVDGTAKKLSRGFLNWNPFKSRWEVSAFGEEIKEIEPGDTIVVPEKLERIAWLREIKDITQILMQMAVTAGVVIKLF